MIMIQRFWKFVGLLLTIIRQKMFDNISWIIFTTAAAIFCFVGIPKPSFAYRPFATEDAGVAGKGVAQLEISWDYLKWSTHDRENVFLVVPIFGITERLELSLEIPYLMHNPEEDKDQEGIGDINIVGKFLIVNETEKYPAFTLKGVVKTSSGDEEKGLGSGDVDYSLFTVTSKTIGKSTLHAMLGYTFVGNNGDDDIKNIYSYGLGLDYGLTEKFHIVGEISGNRHPDRLSDKDPLSGLLGITYKVSEKIILDGGIRYGFNNAVPKWNTTVGISITF